MSETREQIDARLADLDDEQLLAALRRRGLIVSSWSHDDLQVELETIVDALPVDAAVLDSIPWAEKEQALKNAFLSIRDGHEAELTDQVEQLGQAILGARGRELLLVATLRLLGPRVPDQHALAAALSTLNRPRQTDGMVAPEL